MMDNNNKTISDLIDAISTEMERLDYKPSVLKQYHIVWDKLCKYAGEKPIEVFNISFGMDFLEEVLHIQSHPLSEATTHRWMKAINLLSDFKRTGIITLRKPSREFLFAEAFKQPLLLYIGHLKSLERSEAHIRDTSLYLERFSTYLAGCEISDFSQIDAEHIHGYVNSLAIYEIPSIYHTTCVLRNLLKYLYHNKKITQDLSLLVPHVKYNKKAKLPSTYSKAEIEKMIACIDRGNPRGKRDYAIILLAARLGLRALDIANLTFSSFQWDKNMIELIQHKTGKTLVLPLLNEVGEAVIDYLRYARPKSPSDFLFLKLNAPNDVMYANSIHHTVYTRLKEAGIHIPPGKKHGPHALRHSLASAMLENNVSLPVISETLGHSDTKSTSVYLNIDMNRLRECVLEVPDILRDIDREGSQLKPDEMSSYYESIFARYMAEFIRYKRAQGFKYKAVPLSLRSLSRFLAAKGTDELAIDRKIVEEWCQYRPNEKRRTQQRRIIETTQFLKYLSEKGIPVYLPGKIRKAQAGPSFTPYIFSPLELSHFYQECDRLNTRTPSVMPQMLPVLFRLLFGSGLRISEALGLEYRDVDLESGILVIRQSKNNKERMIPVSGSLLEILRNYRAEVHKLKPDDKECFFIHKDHRPVTSDTIYRWFRKIIWAVGISHGGRGSGPRVHDARHTFSVYSLKAMADRGIDIYCALPILSTYLGHASISATECYVRLTQDMFPEIIDKVSSLTAFVIPGGERP